MSTPPPDPPKPFDKRGMLFAVISIGCAALSFIYIDLAVALVPVAVLISFAGLWRVIRGYRGANAPMAIVAATITAAVVYSAVQDFGGAILNGECTEAPGAKGDGHACRDLYPGSR